MDGIVRHKKAFSTIAQRQRVFANIIDCIRANDTFLLLGHELPDEDCIASLVSMALLLIKCGKKPCLFLRDTIPEQLSYLLNICTYNHIPCIQDEYWEGKPPDAIFVLDTPKPEMIAAIPDIHAFIADPSIPVAEIDHHLSADAAYTGDSELCMVTRATSTCELIALMVTKISTRPELCREFGIADLFSRNLVLAMLTGIIGDTQFGLTIRNRRDRGFYTFYTNRFGTILRESHYKNSGNYASMQDIFKTLESLSSEEKELYQKLLQFARYSGNTGYIVLDQKTSRQILSTIEYSFFVKVIKSLTDFLSEKSGVFGMTAYYEQGEGDPLVQFRIRTSRDVGTVDLRTILADFNITDGGGHPGAIGFRISADDIPDLSGYVTALLDKIKSLQKNARHEA